MVEDDTWLILLTIVGLRDLEREKSNYVIMIIFLWEEEEALSRGQVAGESERPVTWLVGRSVVGVGPGEYSSLGKTDWVWRSKQVKMIDVDDDEEEEEEEKDQDLERNWREMAMLSYASAGIRKA